MALKIDQPDLRVSHQLCGFDPWERNRSWESEFLIPWNDVTYDRANWQSRALSISLSHGRRNVGNGRQKPNRPEQACTKRRLPLRQRPKTSVTNKWLRRTTCRTSIFVTPAFFQVPRDKTTTMPIIAFTMRTCDNIFPISKKCPQAYIAGRRRALHLNLLSILGCCRVPRQSFAQHFPCSIVKLPQSIKSPTKKEKATSMITRREVVRLVGLGSASAMFAGVRPGAMPINLVQSALFGSRERRSQTRKPFRRNRRGGKWKARQR